MDFRDITEREKYLEALKGEYYRTVQDVTPDWIKDSPVFDLSNEGEIELVLTKDFVQKYGLESWLANYKKEAQHSTGGIRGPQNILYPWDSRFPINQIGVVLATLGKSLVLRDRISGRDIHKAVSGEVRYNTKQYVELISRVHAACGIYTHQTLNNDPVAIWLASFFIFMKDCDGGEFVTSSHAISSKIATKDLDDQGSQFLPEMSMAFIAKIEEIIKIAKESPGGYRITLAPKKNDFIIQDFEANKLYANYLRGGVATKENVELIRTAAEQGMRLMMETVGGSMYRTMKPLLEEFGVFEVFDWNNKEEDPFFHGVGKTRKLNPKTNQEEFFDLSCDASLPDVENTMFYEYFLKDKPVGYVLFITDPDGDRLVIGQVEPIAHKQRLDNLGVHSIKVGEEKIVSFYHPTFSFLMVMDFYMKQMKKAGLWDKHPRFMVITTPCSRAWDEWAMANGVSIITTPVGFKEIATAIKKIEKKLFLNPSEAVTITDIWGKDIGLGVDPRLAFAGEESGGMIIGPEEIIKSEKGRRALVMREKSAGEASMITAALAAHLFLEKKSMLQYLEEVFRESNIVHRYYERVDITYYNESEPNPEQLLKAKTEGEVKRDKIDLYYLGIVMALRESLVNIDDARKILNEAIPQLDFSDMEDVCFTGDATYFKFKNMFVQVRKSGTDAKLRGYSNGDDRSKCLKYLDALVHYSGEITPLYGSKIPATFRETIYDKTKMIYENYLYSGL
ncbi:MAG: hypothetical protein G01um101420_164 [Parcubacteria group bacterium Gr01-1014_20]|nr:MAG: hypothetical protein G01um101420_164 [Parcubacteria group bacterium Gr01-1014_20]